MLNFVRRNFRMFVEVILWLVLILCVILGWNLGGSFGYSCSYYGGCSGGHPFLGALLGLAVGFIIDVVVGGLIATFVEIGENIEIIKNNSFGVKISETDGGNTIAVQLDSFTDSRDSKVYKTVKIGTQTWMAENLNYEADGSKCYDNNPNNCQKYGRLYDWETAKAACPSGWHLPSKSEYEALDRVVGGEKVAGKKLKAKSGWKDDGNGTDQFGFSALPGGYGGSGGSFNTAGSYGNWWSASASNSLDADSRLMNYNYGSAYWDLNYKSGLFSVRCLQD